MNRSGEEVAGVPAAASVRAIEGDVELALICVPAEAVLAAAEDALESGVRALCVISAGFAEVGAEGAARQERLLALVRSYGGRMIGPNCLGVASTPARLNATFAAAALPPGTVGFASQSGALGLAAVEQARGRGLGLSAFVSLGNKADVSSNDLLEYWEDDAATNVVALYLESFGNPERFSRIARRVARRKPVLALKGGVSAAGARAAASHTAALASSEAAVDALFHQAGVQRMRTLSELLDAAALLSSQPLPLRPARRRADQRRRPRHPLRRRLRGGGAGVARAIGRDARAARRRGAGRGEPPQPRRSARLCHGRDVRRSARPAARGCRSSMRSACSSCDRRSRVPRTSRTMSTRPSPRPARTARR